MLKLWRHCIRALCATRREEDQTSNIERIIIENAEADLNEAR
jgi:hypothetical protein